MHHRSFGSFRAAELLVLALAACGDPPDVSTAATRVEADSADAWSTTLPENTGDVAWASSVDAAGCTYAIGTALESPPFPPLHLALVRRQGRRADSGDHCATAYVVLGTSYATPSVAMIAGHGKLVADFSSKSTPSGEAHTRLSIVALSPTTGVVVRRTELAAMSPDAQRPQLGNVWNGALSLGPAGGLRVEGDKDGIVPGEEGSGERYVALYDLFLVPPGDATPTSVIAY